MWFLDKSVFGKAFHLAVSKYHMFKSKNLLMFLYLVLLLGVNTLKKEKLHIMGHALIWWHKDWKQGKPLVLLFPVDSSTIFWPVLCFFGDSWRHQESVTPQCPAKILSSTQTAVKLQFVLVTLWLGLGCFIVAG